MSSPGVKLHGAGFIVTPAEAAALELGRVPGLERPIRLYLNGRDLTQSTRGVMVIALFGLTASAGAAPACGCCGGQSVHRTQPAQ